jgi:outer membrane receptor protein involved in Fe transport/outer membrane protein OmpA-like peptidoglycan-associated protein
MTFAATTGTAVAQDQPAAGAAAPEEIVVTGSRIRTSDVTSANPLTVVTADQLQQTEAVNLQQYFQKLPSVDFSGAETENNNNGGGGNTQVSLRNLGPNRTLVLLNGQRFPYTDNQNNQSYDAVDTNNIPFSMIDHIEILRDGASSIYGADAIGGVINIITKKNFTGVEVGGSVGETSYDDGLRYQTYVNTGIGNDRGNILINLSHDYQDPISQSARSWAVTQHPEADFNYYDNISSRVTGAVGVIGGSQYYFPSGPNSGILAANAYTLGQPIDRIAYAGGGLTPGDVAIPGAGVYFNFLPTQGLVSGYERTQANFTGHYDLTEGVTLVMEGFYTNRQSNEFLNPEPTGYNTPTPQFPNGFYVPYIVAGGGVNPYFPTALYTSVTGAAPTATSQIPILTRRFENGPRLYTDDVNTFRFKIGLEGTFGDYDWDVGYLYGKSDATYNVQNEANFYHLSQLLGMNPCGSAPGCSVADIFGYNTLTPSQAQYLIFTNTDTSAYAMQDAYGSLSGPVPFVPELPGGPIKAAAGFEMRAESLFDHPDSIVSQGDGAVFTTPTQGHYETYSIYGELQLPVLKDMPFVKSLDVDLSARYDYNSLFGRSLTHKVGVNWAVDDDIRFRGANSTGFRAPQLKELYEGASQGEVGGADPCQPGGTYAGSASCLSAIAAAGANPASIPKLDQITEATGGSPSLHPEVSQEWTAGVVITPSAVKGLAITADYYTILVRNEIGSLDPNQLLSACYGGVPYLVSQSEACTLVGPRLAGTGTLGVIQALNANIGAENTDGIDVTAAYTFGADAIGLPFDGSFQINGEANYLIHDNLYAGGSVVQQAGTFDLNGGDDAEPRWKALLTLGYAQDNWSVQWTTRYYGGVKNVSRADDCEEGSVPCPAAGAGDYEGNEAAGVFYHDISMSYTMDPATVTVGVDNLFDKDPPFLFPTGQSNAAGSAGYDFTGRFIYMKFTAKFGAGDESAPAAAVPYTPPAAQAPAPAPKSYLVFFDFNKSDLTPQAVEIVSTAAKNASTAKVTQLTVTGHTDTVGSDAYNMRLSKRRAESVAAELEKDGVAASEIEIVAKGKRDLLVPTKDGVREPQNRRVQIVFDNGMTS